MFAPALDENPVFFVPFHSQATIIYSTIPATLESPKEHRYTITIPDLRFYGEFILDEAHGRLELVEARELQKTDVIEAVAQAPAPSQADVSAKLQEWMGLIQTELARVPADLAAELYHPALGGPLSFAGNLEYRLKQLRQRFPAGPLNAPLGVPEQPQEERQPEARTERPEAQPKSHDFGTAKPTFETGRPEARETNYNAVERPKVRSIQLKENDTGIRKLFMQVPQVYHPDPAQREFDPNQQVARPIFVHNFDLNLVSPVKTALDEVSLPDNQANLDLLEQTLREGIPHIVSTSAPGLSIRNNLIRPLRERFQGEDAKYLSNLYIVASLGAEFIGFNETGEEQVYEDLSLVPWLSKDRALYAETMIRVFFERLRARPDLYNPVQVDKYEEAALHGFRAQRRTKEWKNTSPSNIVKIPLIPAGKSGFLLFARGMYEEAYLDGRRDFPNLFLPGPRHDTGVYIEDVGTEMALELVHVTELHPIRNDTQATVKQVMEKIGPLGREPFWASLVFLLPRIGLLIINALRQRAGLKPWQPLPDLSRRHEIFGGHGVNYGKIAKTSKKRAIRSMFFKKFLPEQVAKGNIQAGEALTIIKAGTSPGNFDYLQHLFRVDLEDNPTPFPVVNIPFITGYSPEQISPDDLEQAPRELMLTRDETALGGNLVLMAGLAAQAFYKNGGTYAELPYLAGVLSLNEAAALDEAGRSVPELVALAHSGQRPESRESDETEAAPTEVQEIRTQEVIVKIWGLVEAALNEKIKQMPIKAPNAVVLIQKFLQQAVANKFNRVLPEIWAVTPEKIDLSKYKTRILGVVNGYLANLGETLKPRLQKAPFRLEEAARANMEQVIQSLSATLTDYRLNAEAPTPRLELDAVLPTGDVLRAVLTPAEEIPPQAVFWNENRSAVTFYSEKLGAEITVSNTKSLDTVWAALVRYSTNRLRPKDAELDRLYKTPVKVSVRERLARWYFRLAALLTGAGFIGALAQFVMGFLSGREKETEQAGQAVAGFDFSQIFLAGILALAAGWIARGFVRLGHWWQDVGPRNTGPLALMEIDIQSKRISREDLITHIQTFPEPGLFEKWVNQGWWVKGKQPGETEAAYKQRAIQAYFENKSDRLQFKRVVQALHDRYRNEFKTRVARPESREDIFTGFEPSPISTLAGPITNYEGKITSIEGVLPGILERYQTDDRNQPYARLHLHSGMPGLGWKSEKIAGLVEGLVQQAGPAKVHTMEYTDRYFKYAKGSRGDLRYDSITHKEMANLVADQVVTTDEMEAHYRYYYLEEPFPWEIGDYRITNWLSWGPIRLLYGLLHRLLSRFQWFRASGWFSIFENVQILLEKDPAKRTQMAARLTDINFIQKWTDPDYELSVPERVMMIRIAKFLQEILLLNKLEPDQDVHLILDPRFRSLAQTLVHNTYLIEKILESKGRLRPTQDDFERGYMPTAYLTSDLARVRKAAAEIPEMLEAVTPAMARNLTDRFLDGLGQLVDKIPEGVTDRVAAVSGVVKMAKDSGLTFAGKQAEYFVTVTNILVNAEASFAPEEPAGSARRTQIAYEKLAGLIQQNIAHPKELAQVLLYYNILPPGLAAELGKSVDKQQGVLDILWYLVQPYAPESPFYKGGERTQFHEKIMPGRGGWQDLYTSLIRGGKLQNRRILIPVKGLLVGHMAVKIFKVTGDFGFSCVEQTDKSVVGFFIHIDKGRNVNDFAAIGAPFGKSALIIQNIFGTNDSAAEINTFPRLGLHILAHGC